MQLQLQHVAVTVSDLCQIDVTNPANVHVDPELGVLNAIAVSRATGDYLESGRVTLAVFVSNLNLIGGLLF